MIDAENIRILGQQFGIDEVRITSALPFTTASFRIKQQRDNGYFLNSERWHRRNIDLFCNAGAVMSRARSIIAACQCYLTGEKPEPNIPGDPHGSIARYTWRNHYADLRKRLKGVAREIKKQHSAQSIVFSNGEIAEKPVAERSGIGYYGKNSLVINPKYGSYTVLGEIITDLEIEPDQPLDLDCGECRICIDACPTGAIIEPFILDRRRCIQALTNWYGVLPDDIAALWTIRLYGCTDCQDACPANKRVEARAPRADIGYVGPSVSLKHILTISEKEYRHEYARNQMGAGWIDFRAIKRNALVALGNARDKETVPLLRQYIGDRDPVLKETAEWAIARF